MKSILKLGLLPGLLATSMLLSACNGTSTASDEQAKDKQADTTEEAVVTEDVAESASDSVSFEQQMINELVRYRWTLAEATNNSMQSLTSLMDIKEQVTLTFNHRQGQNTISYSVGCNLINATYRLQDQTMLTENGMSTKMLCEDLNQAEDELNQLMQGESQLTLAKSTPPTLTQVTNDTSTLVWQGALTAQAKYNTKGETIFWAVRSATQPCMGNSTQSCLQIKPITYDDQGLKTHEGEWTEFAGTIDGYQHDTAHEQVLRLQRYKLDTSGAAADSSAENYAYVLDSVIESKVVE